MLPFPNLWPIEPEHIVMTEQTLPQQKVDSSAPLFSANPVRRIIEWVIQPPPSLKDELSQRRSRLLSAMTSVIFLLGSAIFFYQFLESDSFFDAVDVYIIFVGIIIVFATYMMSRFGYVDSAAVVFIGVLLIVFVPVAFIPGAQFELVFFSVIPIIVTAVFFSLRATTYMTVGVFVMVVLLGTATQTSVIWPGQFLILSSGVLFVFIRHLQFQEGLRAQELQHINERLRASEENLELRVQERTRDLQVAADVSLQITTVLDRTALLTDVADRTVSAFDLYHVSIFLYDEAHNLLRLAHGVGEVGTLMLEAGKQFRMNDNGLVPQAGRSMQAALADDVTSDRTHRPNPLLPDTRSELAIPMVYRGTLIGVLDLQSRKANRFGGEDIRIMRTLADQIAIAVRNSQLFEETNIAREQAERANAVKSTFLSSMSHELRTPMNAIINFTKFVAKGSMGPVNDQQKETLNEVIDSAKHLLSLINDVLDMSKIEAGSLKLFIDNNVDLNEILRSVMMTGKSLIADKPVELQSEVEPDFPLIMGDRQRIMQILLNVMSNACKFTETGSIRVRAYRDGENVITAISDTGPGIATQDQDLVFEAFRQTETGLRQGGGTGLGLPISRSLVTAHGGNLWFESELGKGSTFYVVLPIKSSMLEATYVA